MKHLVAVLAATGRHRCLNNFSAFHHGAKCCTPPPRIESGTGTHEARMLAKRLSGVSCLWSALGVSYGIQPINQNAYGLLDHIICKIKNILTRLTEVKANR